MLIVCHWYVKEEHYNQPTLSWKIYSNTVYKSAFIFNKTQNFVTTIYHHFGMEDETGDKKKISKINKFLWTTILFHKLTTY